MAETGRPGSGAAGVDEAAADEFRDIIRSRSESRIFHGRTVAVTAVTDDIAKSPE